MEKTTAISPTDFHVLLVLADGPQYGYAVMKAVESESNGAVSPEIGSLYRILGRLMTEGLVRETKPPATAEPDGRGRPRRYYQLTAMGKQVLARETARLKSAIDIAASRKVMID